MHTSIYVGKYVENYLSLYALVYAVTHCIVQLTYIKHWGQNPKKMYLNSIIVRIPVRDICDYFISDSRLVIGMTYEQPWILDTRQNF